MKPKNNIDMEKRFDKEFDEEAFASAHFGWLPGHIKQFITKEFKDQKFALEKEHSWIAGRLLRKELAAQEKKAKKERLFLTKMFDNKTDDLLKKLVEKKNKNCQRYLKAQKQEMIKVIEEYEPFVALTKDWAERKKVERELEKYKKQLINQLKDE